MMDLGQRLLARRLITESGCWEYQGARMPAGYGKVSVGNGRWDYAHRLAYREWVGPIPEGAVIDHLCRNPSCFNPDHLQAVRQRANVIDRGIGPFAQRAAQTHCKRGHEFTPDNTGHTVRGTRFCRECNRAYQRNRRVA